VTRLMLVAPGRAPSAFRNVQLQRLVPRGHKSRTPKRQRAPFRRSRLMLVGPEQAASAFRNVQLQGFEARGHKSNLPKRQKPAFSAGSPYACRLWAKPFRFSVKKSNPSPFHTKAFLLFSLVSFLSVLHFHPGVHDSTRLVRFLLQST
jgi:hypothetical protein